MNFFKNTFPSLFVSATIISACALQSSAASDYTDFFPLYKNSYWLYKGTVNVCQAGESRAQLYHVELKCEVENVYVTKTAVCAEILGFPSDLWWYSGRLKRAVRAIVKKGANQYYLLEDDSATKAINLASRGKSLDDLLIEDCKFIDLPLTNDKIYGKESTADQAGPMFAWQVTNAGDHSAAKGGGKHFTIVKRYNTDHTSYELVPQKGILSASLSHHGTTCDINLKLVDFHR